METRQEYARQAREAELGDDTHEDYLTAADLLRRYGSVIVTREGWMQVATGHGHADRAEGVWGYGRVIA